MKNPTARANYKDKRDMYRDMYRIVNGFEHWLKLQEGEIDCTYETYTLQAIHSLKLSIELKRDG